MKALFSIDEFVQCKTHIYLNLNHKCVNLICVWHGVTSIFLSIVPLDIVIHNKFHWKRFTIEGKPWHFSGYHSGNWFTSWWTFVHINSSLKICAVDLNKVFPLTWSQVVLNIFPLFGHMILSSKDKQKLISHFSFWYWQRDVTLSTFWKPVFII